MSSSFESANGLPATDISPEATGSLSLGSESQAHIARLVLGVEISDDLPAALTQAHYALTGQRLSYEEFTTEAERLDVLDLAEDWHSISVDDRERKVTTTILRELFTKDVVQYANVLLNWPLHQHMFETHVLGTAEGAVMSHPESALLIGAYHALSAKTFDDMARDLYNARRTLIVDKQGAEDKLRHGTFAFADGTELPFRDSAIQIVQTNQLFGWLGEELWASDVASQQIAAQKLLAEAYRVLQPGGYLLSCETALGYDFKDKQNPDNPRRVEVFRSWLDTSLAEAGFEATVIEPSFTIKGDEYLFDTGRNFDRNQRIELPWAVGICARKPA
jgi:SAM-dependent methyltransferase